MDKNVFGWFLVGAGVGIGIGILIAPQTGEHMRGRVKAKADGLKQRVSALTSSAADLVGGGKRVATERRLDEEAQQRMDSEGGTP